MLTDANLSISKVECSMLCSMNVRLRDEPTIYDSFLGRSYDETSPSAACYNLSHESHTHLIPVLKPTRVSHTSCSKGFHVNGRGCKLAGSQLSIVLQDFFVAAFK